MPKANINLKILRLKYNLSQKDAGKLLSITASAYNRKENGIRSFTIEEAGKLAKHFNTTVDEIFFTDSVTKCITKII
ncbi:helix-turn-helix transcriptional regulator [Clostridium botulinum]|uniref:helix-turn-helix transcriptional regulator n=1 Tax=Clostridium botulinum TaxID=1491 RepID=UPI000957B124|nr:helix-turn-helix transcriptional regulator [Clostridium botulinum]APU61248.1 helix-turn-helix family protein [Clostridium botulinum]BDB02187.1 transcriptional regulatory protein [Clostridium botulinum]